ncbi:hypothetical protein BDY24DRAFT_388631 [Mrakia frigida]|uniref:uncharacterized protein n=1 Tax=Mrakia frigida TaxID=29902 RepID=UPI003FCC1C46
MSKTPITTSTPPVSSVPVKSAWAKGPPVISPSPTPSTSSSTSRPSSPKPTQQNGANGAGGHSRKPSLLAGGRAIGEGVVVGRGAPSGVAVPGAKTGEYDGFYILSCGEMGAWERRAWKEEGRKEEEGKRPRFLARSTQRTRFFVLRVLFLSLDSYLPSRWTGTLRLVQEKLVDELMSLPFFHFLSFRSRSQSRLLQHQLRFHRRFERDPFLVASNPPFHRLPPRDRCRPSVRIRRRCCSQRKPSWSSTTDEHPFRSRRTRCSLLVLARRHFRCRYFSYLDCHSSRHLVLVGSSSFD